MTTENLPRIPIDEEERLRKLTRAQRSAYRDMLAARPGEWRWASSHGRQHETLAAVVDAGLAEWRSAYPDSYPDSQHYIVPLGTETYKEMRVRLIAENETRLGERADRIIKAAGLNAAGELKRLVTEIVRELEPNGAGR